MGEKQHQQDGNRDQGEGAPLRARGRYIETLRTEIRLLARTLADDPTKRLSDLQVEWAGKSLNYAQVVDELAKSDESTSSTDMLLRIGLLQAIKDALVAKTTPATSLSIAYTTLVVGEQQSDDAESIHTLSRRIFGNLQFGARRYAWFVRLLAAATLAMTGLAAWESTKASVGKNLLQGLEPLRALQSSIASDRFKLEMTLDKAVAAGSGSKVDNRRFVPVCLRYMLNASHFSSTEYDPLRQQGVRWHESPEIRELCGRDDVLAHNFDLVHVGIQNYMYFWPDLAGGLYSVAGHTLAWVHDLVGDSPSWRKVRSLAPIPQSCADPAPRAPADGSFSESNLQKLQCGDIEFLAAPVVKVITDFTLPFLFGVIGSMLYVLLQHYANVRTNTLRPIHEALAYLRVILGIVVAACVSLFITSYASPPIQTSPGGSFGPTTLVNSLTLSASGITFLAGFGAEAVFTLLQQLVDRVFALPKQ